MSKEAQGHIPPEYQKDSGRHSSEAKESQINKEEWEFKNKPASNVEEEPPTEIAPKYVHPEQQGPDWHYVVETEKGKKQFTVEKVTDPEDSRLEQDVQKLLAKTFGKSEVDPIEVTQEAMKDKDDPYYAMLINDEKGKLAGVILCGNIRIWGENSEVSQTDRILYEPYIVVPKKFRSQGHAKALEGYNMFKEAGAAEMQGQNLRGLVTESEPDAIAFHDKIGKRRLYFKNDSGGWQEVPYWCIPLEWNPKTGEPAKDAEALPYSLMFMSNDSSRSTLQGSQVVDLVRTMSYYNSWNAKDFKNVHAYGHHIEIVDGYVQEFADAVGNREVRMIGEAERARMIKEQGARFNDNVLQPEETETSK